jgi:hypothetical protein
MGRHSAAAVVVALLNMVILALLLRAGLALWVDCGKACGAKARAKQTQERPKDAR